MIIVTLYDQNSLKNIISTLALKPSLLLVLATNDISLEINNIQKTLLSHKITTKVQQLFFKETEFEEVLKNLNENYIFDLTGGNELCLAKAAIYCFQHDIACIYYDIKQNQVQSLIKNVNMCKVRLDIKQFIEIFNAKILDNGSGHDKVEIGSKINDLVSIIKNNRDRWNKNVSYLQAVTSLANNDKIKCKSSVIYKNRLLIRQNDVLRQLENIEMIKIEKINQNMFFLSFENDYIQKLLTSQGYFLEVYIYYLARSCNYFDDVRISTIIDWDKQHDSFYDTKNEIDVIVIKNNLPLFISCKSRHVTNEDLFELNTLLMRFDQNFVKGAVVCDLKNTNMIVKERAFSMKIALIDYYDDKKRIINLLKNV